LQRIVNNLARDRDEQWNHLNSVVHLINQQYWTRLWIVQELRLAHGHMSGDLLYTVIEKWPGDILRKNGGYGAPALDWDNRLIVRALLRPKESKQKTM
jgi:hypothetical protein